MKIQHVTFLGVHGVADASLDFTDPKTGEPHSTVILSGPQASGKTRALEAIIAAKEAIAPYGPAAPSASWIARSAAVAKVGLTIWLDEEERTFAGSSSPTHEGEVIFYPGRARREADEGLIAVLDRFVIGRALGKVEYVPASRRPPSHPPYGGVSALEQRVVRASTDARKYSFIPRFLLGLGADAAAARAFAERLAALSPTCVYEREATLAGVPRCLRSRGGPLVAVHELSDSEADAVLLAATAVAIDLNRSLLLIDRPDLYADPSDAPRLLAGLRALGDDNQLVLASSSPGLAAAAGAGESPGLVVRLQNG